jgi:hypothetical protein
MLMEWQENLSLRCSTGSHPLIPKTKHQWVKLRKELDAVETGSALQPPTGGILQGDAITHAQKRSAEKVAEPLEQAAKKQRHKPKAK